MIAAYATGLACLLCSAAVGAATARALGWRHCGPVCVPIGFAALVSFSALAIRLPGRGTTLAVLVIVASLACGLYVLRGRRGAGRSTAGPGRTSTDHAFASEIDSRQLGGAPAGGRSSLVVALAAILALFALGSIPFALGAHVGVLGEGVYTNDHAAQLYWTDWLQNGFGPEPTAVSFGYPTGPQSLTAALAEPFGASLLDAFNGLLLAIGALTALGALSTMGAIPPARRLLAAILVGLPYLGASYFAQSAFKETAMALLVLCLAVVLSALGRGAPRRGVAVSVAILAAGALFTYSLPGLAWFLLGIPLWVALEVLLGRRFERAGASVRSAVLSRRGGLVGGAVLAVVIAVAVIAGPQISEFAQRIGAVQSSVGRLGSPVWPGEALGVWPEGDFRLVRGEVSGAYPATLLGLLVAGLGAWAAFRRRDLGLLSILATCAVIYAGSYLFASIYVEAKALAILAPLLMLVTMLGLLAPGTGGRGRGPRLAFGALAVVFMLAAGVSTLLALRAAPVGFQERGGELEHLADVAAGDPLLFLGVDRFGTYWLRGTLAESPGGYFAPEVSARPQKAWQQGDPVDFDTTEPARMDRFDWAITSAGEYGSTPPPNWEEVERTAGFVLWRREGETPAQLVLNEGGMAARILECPPGTDADDVVAQFETEPESKADPSDDEALGETGPSRGAATPLEALVGYPTTVIRQVYADRDGWRSSTQLEAPGSVSRRFELAPGIWDLSLQYASQVDIVVEAGGQSVELPASLAGMYLTEKGGGSFWPAGQVQVRGNRPVRVTISSDEPTGLEQAVGASRRTWVGDLAATRPSDRPQVVSLRQACGLYVDHTEFPVFAGSSGG